MLPFVAGAIALGPRPSAVLFGAAAAIACSEYYRLTLGSLRTTAWIGIGAAAAVPLVPGFSSANAVAPALFGIVAAASSATWIFHLFGRERASAPERAGHVLAGLLFSSVGLAALSALRAGPNGIAWTAVVLVASWANDTAAYLGGRAVGRHKLWPAVSPQKTWEGFACGLLGGVLALAAIRPWLPRFLDARTCLALGAVTGFVAPLGDLCKSMLKRAYQVKDTGHLFPGHGGMLDRIDGILVVAQVVWIIRWTLSLP